MVYADWMCFDSPKTYTQRTNSQISKPLRTKIAPSGVCA